MKKLLFIIGIYVQICLQSYGQTDLIQNGNFSSSAGWTTSGNWHISSSHTCYKSSPSYAYAGDLNGFAVINESGDLMQAVTIPNTATSATLTFYTSKNTDEVAIYTPYDYVFVYLLNASGIQLIQLNITPIDNTTSDKPLTGCGPYGIRSSDIPSTYFGQKIFIDFRVHSDGGPKNTMFRIDDVSLTYNAPSCIAPNIISQPSNQNPTAPSGTSFSISASGSNNIYQWQYNTGSGWVNVANSSPYSGVNSATLNISTTSSGMNGYQYRCYVSSSCTISTSTSNAAKLTVSSVCPAPSINSQPSNTNPTAPNGTSFSISASGSNNTYQWQYNKGSGWVNVPNSSPYSGVNSSTLSISTTSSGMTGYQYRCYVTSSCTSSTATSNAATLTVSTLCASVSISTNPSNQSVTAPRSATFSAGASGTTPFTFQWQYLAPAGSWTNMNNSGNNTWTTTGSNSTLTITKSTGLNNYKYRCVISNSCPSSATSSSATLTLVAAINQYTISTQTPYNIFPFTNPFPLANGNSSASAPTIKICADGSNATKMKYVNNDGTVNSNNIRFWIASDQYGNNTDISGYFVNYQVNGNTITAEYAHPKYIQSSYLPFRPDNIQIVDYTNPNPPLYTIPIAIYRAPVLFVHGWNGNEETFLSMAQDFLMNKYYPQNPQVLCNVGYYSTSLDNFATNARVIPNLIHQAFYNSLSGSFSAGKVDLVCHSMGGIISRLYLQNNYGNYYNGDINKLITINTPHSGMYLADAATAAVAIFGSTYCGISNLINLNSFVCNGALIDLQTYSYATDHILNDSYSLSLNHVPSHTITTTLATTPSSYYNTPPFLMTGLFNTMVISLFNSMLKGLPSDGVVSLNSQTGGLSGGFTSQPTNHFHMGSTLETSVKDDVKQLLCADPNGGQFSLNGFNPPNIKKSQPMPKQFVNKSTELKSSKSAFVNIIAPTNKNSYNPNQLITITINSDKITKRLLVLAGNASIGITSFDTTIISNTTNLKYTIPTNAFGKLEIDAIGFDSINNVTASDSVTFNVNVTATLDSIKINPHVILVPTNLKSNFQVIGYYSDELHRDMTLISGVQYSIDKSGIAKIISPGIIEGIKIDSTKLTVSFHGISETVPIYVYEGASLSHALFSSNTNAICDSGQVEFYNLSSGHPKSIKWFFPGGKPSTSSDSIPIVFYNSIGNYDVTLIATYSDKIDTLSLPGFIKVESKPISRLNLNNDTIYCSFNNGYAYQWYHNYKPIDSSYQLYIHPDSSGYYYADIMNNAGCLGRSDTLYYNINGTKNYSNNIYFEIYPNPANDKITIENISKSRALDKMISIYNIEGQIIIQTPMQQQKIELNISDLANGIYILKLSNSENILIKKFVKD